jgi:hypothetical protein
LVGQQIQAEEDRAQAVLADEGQAALRGLVARAHRKIRKLAADVQVRG